MVIRAAAALLLATSSVVLVTASPAQACSCAGEPASVGVREASAIFTGTLEGERRGDGDTSARVLTYAVDRVWKGDVTSSTEIGTSTAGGTCGLEVDEGEHMLVFATLQESGGLTSNICTSRGATVQDVERLLGPGEPPAAGRTSHPVTASLWGWAEVAGGGLLLLLGLSGVAAYVVGRVRRRTAGG